MILGRRVSAATFVCSQVNGTDNDGFLDALFASEHELKPHLVRRGRGGVVARRVREAAAVHSVSQELELAPQRR